MPKHLFGSLWFEGMVGKGENPNGVVRHTASGCEVDLRGADGDQYPPYYMSDGSRWAHKPKEPRMMPEYAAPGALGVTLGIARRRR